MNGRRRNGRVTAYVLPLASLNELQSTEAIEGGRDLLCTRPGDVPRVIAVTGQPVDPLRIEHVLDFRQSFGE